MSSPCRVVVTAECAHRVPYPRPSHTHTTTDSSMTWSSPWSQTNDPLAITLAVSCTLIWFSVLQQLRLIVRGGHNFYSLQTGVLLLTMAWLPLRVLFWAKCMVPSTWSDSFMLMLYALPTCLMFSAFSCLALFYARVVNWKAWNGHQLVSLGSDSDESMRYGGRIRGGTPQQRQRHRRYRRLFGLRRDKAGKLDVRSRYLLAFWVSNSASWLMTITFGLVDARAITLGDSASLAASQLRVTVDSIIYLALAAVLAVLGVRFWHSLQHGQGGGMFTTQMLPRSPKAFAALNGCLCFAFAFRAIMQMVLLYSTETPLLRAAHTLQYNGAHGALHPLIFALYMVWEVIPTGAVILILGKVLTYYSS